MPAGKLDAPFSVAQFCINGFQLHTDWIEMKMEEKCTRKYYQQNYNKKKFPDDIEAIFIEMNLRKCKWLLCTLYHPPSQSDQYRFKAGPFLYRKCEDSIKESNVSSSC